MCQTLILIAAGTGLTPMIRIINYVIKKINSKNDLNVYLLFFNKTQNDILCQEELQTISNQYK
jgi:cytochrome-b5 reductase